MVRCYSVEEVKATNAKGMMEAVAKGYWNEDDALESIVQFNQECDELYNEHDIQLMLMFTEAHEMEDEEFGLALIDDQWQMVYLACNNSQVRFVI